MCFSRAKASSSCSACSSRADASGAVLDEIARPDAEGRDLIHRAAERLGLTARGYHRVLRTARTIADLDGSPDVRAPHLAEALGYRLSYMGM